MSLAYRVNSTRFYNPKLPVELWTEVFCFATYTSKITRDINTISHAASFRTSLAISHVCRLWRAIAVDCSTIWAQSFDIGLNEDMMEVILERIRNRNVDFVIPRGLQETNTKTNQPWWPSAMDTLEIAPASDVLLWEAYEKSTELHAVVSMDDQKLLKWNPLDKRVPFLKRISLTLADADPTKPGLLFDKPGAPKKSAPKSWNVRSLALDRCFFTFRGLHMGDLQELWVSGLTNIVGARIKPYNWATALAKMGQLRSLTLIDAIAGSSCHFACRVIGPTPEFPYEWISLDQWVLPSLEDLKLVCSSNDEEIKNDCREFLERIVISPKCVVDYQES